MSQGARDHIRELIKSIGDNPDRPGLKETPDRVIRSFSELFRGYNEDPQDILKSFDAECEIEDFLGIEKWDDIVIMRNVEVYSTCEHHMLPFSGVAHIAYVADSCVIGASKMARLVDVFARRLQIQERIGRQVSTALMKYLKPAGAGCIIEAKHMCMMCRGVRKQHSDMVTVSMLGSLREQSIKMELLMLLLRNSK